MYLFHVEGVSSVPLKVKVEEDNTVWYWTPHFLVNKCKGTFSWRRVDW